MVFSLNLAYYLHSTLFRPFFQDTAELNAWYDKRQICFNYTIVGPHNITQKITLTTQASAEH